MRGPTSVSPVASTARPANTMSAVLNDSQAEKWSVSKGQGNAQGRAIAYQGSQREISSRPAPPTVRTELVLGATHPAAGFTLLVSPAFEDR